MTVTPTSTSPISPSGPEASVTRIIDGDTIEVQIGSALYKVRYIGINAPELTSNDLLAAEATKLNYQLVSSKTVRLEKDTSETDVYGRLLRYVYVNDVSVNAELVKAGLARATPYPPDIKKETLFKSLENDAAKSGVGLWALPQITQIFYDGVVPSVESDEYVEISNFSGKTIDLTGWTLQDRPTNNGTRHTFTFPAYALSPGKVIRVYTNETHPEWGGFSFKSTGAIWNNDGDEASLSDSRGMVISRKSYQVVK